MLYRWLIYLKAGSLICMRALALARLLLINMRNQIAQVDELIDIT